VLGYAIESDCRTSFRLFCRTRYEISSESNVRLGSDYRKFSRERWHKHQGGRKGLHPRNECMRPLTEEVPKGQSLPHAKPPQFSVWHTSLSLQFLRRHLPSVSRRTPHGPTDSEADQRFKKSPSVAHPRSPERREKSLHKSVRGRMAGPRWTHSGYLRDLQRGRHCGVLDL